MAFPRPTGSPMTHEQELEGYILQGMARAIWGHAFVQWATNVDPPPEFGAGKDWSEVTPPVPPGALKAARDFARGMGELNHLGPTPMTQMFSATRRYVQPRRSATRATEADQAFQFGEDVAQACLGTLEVPELGQYKIPEMKAMLDDDGQRLSWDEGWTWHGNPPGENMWAILVDGDRKWEFGRTPDQALEFARQRYGKRWPISLELGEDGRYIRGTRGHTEMPDATAHWSKNPARWSNSDVQSLLFDKARYTTRQAQRWAQDHGFRYGSVDEGHGDFIHLRQFAHRPGQPCATVDFGHQGIQAVVCSTRNPRHRAEMTLQQFAADVNAELPYITPEPGDGAKGRFGDRKVFIAALWRQLRASPAFKGMTLEQFKERLVEAHGKRLLVLVRADMVAAMDPAEVAQSEWVAPDRGRSYHFVVDQSVP